MKILNISRYLPIKGFPPINDITLKIYADLNNVYGVESEFIMPLSHIPRWATIIKKSLKSRFKTVNNRNYIDIKYGIPIHFFEGYFAILSKRGGFGQFQDLKFQFFFYKSTLFRRVIRYKPDLVHAHTLEDAYYAYKINKRLKIPYVVTLRGFYHELYTSKLIKEVLNKAQKITTPSARLKSDLEDLFEIELLPHGIDAEWYLTEEKDFDAETLRIITVASLIEMKNIQTVIRSIAKLIHQGHKINYSIVGEGPYKKNLQELILKENIEEYVTFHGFLSQKKIRELYKNNEVFIMLSYPETFGRVFFEAAAQGLLIIGRKGTGIDGYFNENEAFILDGEISELTRTLKKINSNIVNSMTSNSTKRILNFKNDHIIQKYYEILNDNC